MLELQARLTGFNHMKKFFTDTDSFGILPKSLIKSTQFHDDWGLLNVMKLSLKTIRSIFSGDVQWVLVEWLARGRQYV